MTTQAAGPVRFWKEILLPTSTVALAVIAAWQTYRSGALEERFREQEAQFERALASQQELRETTEGQQAFLLRVFEYVENTISADSTDRRREEAALALVRTLPDSESKLALIKILETGSQNETVRREASQEAFALLDQNPNINSVATFAVATAPPSGSSAEVASPQAQPATAQWKRWDIDLFWCVESGASARQVADRTAAVIVRQGAQGRIRVRELPRWQNAQPGYGYDGLVVAFNAGREGEVAQQLATVIREASPGAPVRVREVRSQTNGYLSSFICPARRDDGASVG